MVNQNEKIFIGGGIGVLLILSIFGIQANRYYNKKSENKKYSNSIFDNMKDNPYSSDNSKNSNEYDAWYGSKESTHRKSKKNKK
jgi:hypothetical protein